MTKYLPIVFCLMIVFLAMACNNMDTTIDDEEENNNAGPTGCCKPACKLSSASECNVDWHEGVACEVFDECQEKCCVPHCQTDFAGHCRQTGGTPDNRQCSDIPDCQEGCCSPMCGFMKRLDCNDLKGNFFPGSCKDDPACEEGCCMPLCASFTQAQCSKEQGYDGKWHKGSCEQFPECKKICCLPNGEMMNVNECKQFNGKEYPAEYCAGPSTIEIIIDTKHSGSCKQSEPNSDSCEVFNDFFQKYAGTFIPDPDGAKNDYNAGGHGGKTYYFKGFISNSLTGTSTQIETDSGEQPCSTFPVTYKPYRTKETDTYQYLKTISEETFLYVTELDEGGYQVQLGGAFQDDFVAKRIFSRSVSGNSCLGEDYDKETDSGEDLIDMISGSMIEDFTVDKLSGTMTNTDGQGYITEMMRPDEGPDTTTVITWDIKIKE